jgi:hypothetical protein
MAKKSRRSSRRSSKRSGGLHIASRIMAPVDFVLNTAGSTVKHVARATGKIVRTGLHGVRKIGNSVANSANKMVDKMTRRRRRN